MPPPSEIICLTFNFKNIKNPVSKQFDEKRPETQFETKWLPTNTDGQIAPNTDYNCCSVLVINGAECDHNEEYNEFDSYYCADQEVIFKLTGKWYYSLSGPPVNDVSYKAYKISGISAEVGIIGSVFQIRLFYSFFSEITGVFLL